MNTLEILNLRSLSPNIGAKQEHRCLKIASVNPDNSGNYNVINTIINEISINNIDIACIRETHNSRIDMMNIGGICNLLWGEQSY